MSEVSVSEASDGQKQKSTDLQSELRKACVTGNLEQVKNLLSKGANPHLGLGRYNGNGLNEACSSGNLELVKFLVEDINCDPCSMDDDGFMPLHVSCWSGQHCIVTYFVEHTTCYTDDLGPTLLNCVCRSRVPSLDVMEYLLKNLKVDPNQLNDKYPLDLVFENRFLKNDSEKQQQAIRLLYEYGAKPPYEVWTLNTDDTQKPAEAYSKLFLIGEPAGDMKSTLAELIETDSQEQLDDVPSTSDIVTKRIVSQSLGNVIMYDLAGHMMYASHKKALRNALVGSSSSIFLLVSDMSGGDEPFEAAILKWCLFAKNLYQESTTDLPFLVIVGSHADKTSTADVDACEQVVSKLQDSTILSSFRCRGFVHLDCHHDSNFRIFKSELWSILSKCRHQLKKEESLSVQELRFFACLLDIFRNVPAVTIKEVIAKNKETQGSPKGTFIPKEVPAIVDKCVQLNKGRVLLFLSNTDHLEDSWIVLQKDKLLQRVSKELADIATDTGIVPVSKLPAQFPDINQGLIVSFLCRLQICFEVTDLEVLQQLSVSGNNSKSEKFLFFPNLVSVTAPVDVWSSDHFTHESAWVLQCHKSDQFLPSRFQDVTIHRLAFSCAMAPRTSDEQQSMQRRCRVWNNGLFWTSLGGIDTVLQITDSKRLVLITRSRKGCELAAVHLRSQVISKIRSTKSDHCLQLRVDEYFAHSDSITFPLSDKAPLVSIQDIATSVIFCHDLSAHGHNVPINDLLHFEAFANIGKDILKELFENEDAELSDVFLSQIADRAYTKTATFLNILDISSESPACTFEEASQPDIKYKLCRALELWKNRHSTYSSLCSRLSEYSIFAGRNPLQFAHNWLEEEMLYKEAMAKDYKISLRYAKILALGPGQVGKSTFLYRLMELMKGNIKTCQKIDPKSLPQCSTGVTELHEAACIRYTSMTGALKDKTWHVFNNLKSQLQCLISLLKKQTEDSYQIHDNKAVPVKSEALTAPTAPAGTVHAEESCTEKSGTSVFYTDQSPVNHDPVDKQINPSAVIVPGKQNVAGIIQEFEKLREESNHSIVQDKSNSHMLFTIADIGGQPAYLEMLPSLTIGPALYLVFMKLLEGLKTRYPTAFKCKTDGKTKICQNYTYTSEEVIFTALSSIACFGHSDKEVEKYVAKADEKQTNSLALIVGTHVDQIENPGKLSAIDDELKQHIEETEFHREGLIYSKNFLRVNNYSAEDDEIKEHRQLLEKILTNKFRQFNIPARWLMLSICLKLLAINEGTHEVSFNDCVEIGKHFQMRKEMVKIALQFLHKYIGLVMYFPNHKNLKNVVICDPQAVFTSISELVFKIYDPTNLQVTEAQHDHFVQTGCFSPQDIKPVAKDDQTQTKLLSIATLINLLVHLNIIAEVPCSDPVQEEKSNVKADTSTAATNKLEAHPPSKRREYVFPAVLQTAEVDTLKRIRSSLITKARGEQLPQPICIRFKTGYMPLGFVCALSAKLIAERKLQLIFEEDSDIMTYKNMLKFRYNGEFDILMVSGPKYCEFHVTRHTGIADFWSEDCCPQIKKTICDAADSVVCSMKHGSLYKLSKGYELAFKCPQHQDAEFGHEPLATFCNEPTSQATIIVKSLPMRIQCVKTTCKTAQQLTPEMKMWFGEGPECIPLEISCCKRELKRLKITTKGGSKPLKFQWFKDEEPLTDSACYSGSTPAELVIDPELKAMYKCCVTDRKDTTMESREIYFDPFVLLCEMEGLKQKDILKLKEHGYESIDDLKFLKMDDTSLKAVDLKGPEIYRVRDFVMKHVVPTPARYSEVRLCQCRLSHDESFHSSSTRSNVTSISGPTSTASNTGLTTDQRIEQPPSTKRPKLDPTVAKTERFNDSDQQKPSPKRRKTDNSYHNIPASPGYTNENGSDAARTEDFLKGSNLNEIEPADMGVIAQHFDSVELYMDQLGLTPAEQTDMKAKAQALGNQVAMTECLKCWRKHSLSAVTYQALVNILLKLGKKEIAQKICEYATSDHT